MAVGTSRWRVSGYTELRELGSGAQGRVVLARRRGSGEIVAIKYLAAAEGADPRALETLRREAETLARVADPNIAGLYHYAEMPGAGAAIVMEAVDGVSLRRVLDDCAGALSPEAALVVLKGSLLGLAAAHSVGVVHRDYKPANVLVGADGRSKLIDFGIAVLTGQGGRAGTPSYMAPEQWRDEPATPATDLYAATCVFFECVTGRQPFGGGDVHTVRDQHLTAPVPVQDVPEPLRPLVLRGLSKSPGERLWDAGEFVAELEATAVRAYGPSWERQGWAALGAAAAALAAVFPYALLGSWAVTGLKGLVAKLGGAKTASAVGGTAAVAVVVAFLLWPSPPFRPAWNTDAIVPVEPLQAVPGGFIAAGATKAGRFELVKLDAGTGALRWRHPLSVEAHGWDSRAQVQGDTVVFTQGVAGDEDDEQVVAVDTDTGRVRWRHGQEGLDLSTGAPQWCGSGKVCLGIMDTLRPPSTATERIRVLDGASGAQLSESGPLGWIRLGPGLHDSMNHKDIVRTTAAGRVLWRRPVSEIFGEVKSLDLAVYKAKEGGRNSMWIQWPQDYDIQLKDGRYVGEISGGGKYVEARRARRLDHATVAAFDAATGRKLWAAPGTTVFCGELDFTIGHPVRCRKTGWLDVSPEDPKKWRLENVNVTVEAFDPATGKTRWSWQAGAVRGLALDTGGIGAIDQLEDDRSVIRIDELTYLIRSPSSGTVLLNLDTGPRPARDVASGWCWDKRLGAQAGRDTQNQPYWKDPQRRWWPCGADGREIELPGKTTNFVGARSGDAFAWPGGNGVQAVYVE